MAKKIFKYPLPNSGAFKLKLPFKAEILSVHQQGTNVCLWALVDENEELVNRRFIIAPTGVEIDEAGSLKFIGAFFPNNAQFVFHVFEQI